MRLDKEKIVKIYHQNKYNLNLVLLMYKLFCLQEKSNQARCLKDYMEEIERCKIWNPIGSKVWLESNNMVDFDSSRIEELKDYILPIKRFKTNHNRNMQDYEKIWEYITSQNKLDAKILFCMLISSSLCREYEQHDADPLFFADGDFEKIGKRKITPHTNKYDHVNYKLYFYGEKENLKKMIDFIGMVLRKGKKEIKDSLLKEEPICTNNRYEVNILNDIASYYEVVILTNIENKRNVKRGKYIVKQCESCGREIPMNGKYCPYCGRMVRSNNVDLYSVNPKWTLYVKSCPHCGKENLMEHSYCAECGSTLEREIG